MDVTTYFYRRKKHISSGRMAEMQSPKDKNKKYIYINFNVIYFSKCFKKV